MPIRRASTLPIPPGSGRFPPELPDQIAKHKHPERRRVAERLERHAEHRDIERQRAERARQHADRPLTQQHDSVADTLGERAASKANHGREPVRALAQPRATPS